MSKEVAREKVQRLVESYDAVVRDGRKAEFSEADVGSKFILPLLSALGWDVTKIEDVKEQRRTLAGVADYSLLNVGGTAKIFLELKKFEEDLDNTRRVGGKVKSYPQMAIDYAWQSRADWAILTNFEEIRLYYSHVRKPEEGLIFKVRYNDYLTYFDRLWLLSKESIVSGLLDTYEKRRLRRDVDEELLKDLVDCRKLLVANVRKNNSQLSKDEINESTQKILDRLMFIRSCEDRLIISAESLWTQFSVRQKTVIDKSVWKFMMDLKNIFREFDTVYNGQLFAPHPCEDLRIDNDVLEAILVILYNYNFDLVPVDVLGNAYELYIGTIIKEKEGALKEDELTLVEEPSVRKKHGIYYTPEYVVDYIVRSTLGELLNNCKTVDDVSKIKVLDPACGSGSFLIKAFDVIREWYDSYNKQNQRNATPNTLDAHIHAVPDVEDKILTDNLYGVDLDPQAVEIAILNLSLRAVKSRKKLPFMGDHIKRGNSLISGTDEELERYFKEELKEEQPFNWQREFVELFEAGGFDIVIGNPPHGAKLSKEEREFLIEKYQVAKGYKNTASLFIERVTQLMKNEGILGLVIPKSLTFSQKWSVTRDFILQNLQLLEIIDISKAFQDVLLEQIILICRRRTEPIDSYHGTKLLWGEKPETYSIPLSLCKKLDAFPTHVDPTSLAIYKKIMEKSLLLKTISKTFRGLPIQAKASQQKTADSVPLLRGDDIKTYFCFVPDTFIERKYLDEKHEKSEALRQPKIISQRIVAHVLTPTDHIILMSTLDQEGLLNVDTVENTIITDPKYDAKYVLAFLNSKMISWFAYTFIFNKAVRTMDLDDYYVSKMPIFPANKDEQKLFGESVESLLRLTKQLVESKAEFKEYINRYPRIENTNLEAYYRKAQAQDKQTLAPSNLKGAIKNLEVHVSENWLIFRICFTSDGKENKEIDVLKLRIDNEILREFVAQSLLSSRKNLGKGNILAKLLGLPIPRFSKNEERNFQIITEMMRDYQKILGRVVQLKDEISNLEMSIDRRIYDLYNLDENEIGFIESSLGRDSVILRLLD
jgi:hypothetical protein